MNKSKHVAVDFVNEDKAIKLVNDPRFMSLEEFPGNCYEVNIFVATLHSVPLIILSYPYYP